MVDFLVAATLSNLLVSTILAVLAWVVQRRIPSPGLVNLLWGIVLIKLVTPPIVAIPAMTIPSITGADIPSSAAFDVERDAAPVAELVKSFGPTSATPKVLTTSATTDESFLLVQIGFFVWVSVGAMLFAVSGVRILRFHWLLISTCRIDQELSRGLASSVARQFGLRNAPDIVVTPANVAPFVWWMAGRGVIVFSTRATKDLNQTDLRLIITHEMAHVKRRDHWFRWIEWFVLIIFWWNPIMWWARRQLRDSEEMACDQLVLQTAKSEVNQYANSLLNMADLLASPEIRPPVMASAINSGGSFERRLNAMMSGRNWTAPAALQIAVVVMAMCVFPLGFVYAQDFKAVERRLGGAVEAGELSLEQANLMMEALRRSSHGDREMEAKKRRFEQVARKIEEAHEAGELSEEEAEEKLIHLQREMFEHHRHEDEARELEAKKRHFEQVARRIKEAHETGELSEEEAEEKLIHLQREMFEHHRHEDEARELEAKKRRYEQVARKIEEAHEAGELSEEEAEEKLIHLQREMFEHHRHEDEARELEAKKRRYEQVARKIKEAHEAGELSEKEAEKKLIHLQREMFEHHRHEAEAREMEAKKRRFEQVARKIQEAHEAGELSEEEAEEKLIHLQREMFEHHRHEAEEEHEGEDQ